MDVLITLFLKPFSSSPAGLLGLLVAGLALSGTGLSADRSSGDPVAGASKAVTCAACHGADGNSLNPEWPNIGGQHSNYLQKSLASFKSGARQNVLMGGMAMPLTDTDMQDLGAYFAKQTPASARVADPSLVSAGERLYRGGNQAQGTPACLACHGPTGQGNGPAGWPAIGGQHAPYLKGQLLAYRDQTRTTDGRTQMMRNVAATLSDADIGALSSYLQGLN